MVINNRIFFGELQFQNMGHCVSHADSAKYREQNQSAQKKIGIKQFKFIKVVGKGGFSKVWKAQEKRTGKIYAIKVMSKAKIIAKKSVKAVLQERRILSRLSESGVSFITKMHGSFQDNAKLYLLMDYLQGNTLRHHLICGVTLSETQIRLIVMTLVKTFQFLYKHKIIHGDLKPENILFDKEGVPFLTDFGAASYIQHDNSDYNSGTIGYMAPEVMQYQNHNFAADYYAIGVITYQLILKKRPYVSRNKQDLLKQLRKKPVNPQNFPELNEINPLARDFITKLMQRKPQNRLGYNGIHQLSTHPWMNFELTGIDVLQELNNIRNIFQSEVCPPQLSDQSNQSDEMEYDEQKYVNFLGFEHVQEMFEGFNFIVPPNLNPQVRVRKSSFEMVEHFQSTQRSNNNQ